MNLTEYNFQKEEEYEEECMLVYFTTKSGDSDTGVNAACLEIAGSIPTLGFKLQKENAFSPLTRKDSK